MSKEIIITLPDSSTLSANNGDTVYNIIGKIGKGLQQAAVAAEVNGEERDLAFVVNEDVRLKVFTFKETEGKDIFWHSASHLMAQAVKRLFPDAKLAIGPAIDSGFYYDFEIERPLNPEDLDSIEAEMEKLVEENLQVTREEITKGEAIKIFSDMKEDYKVEMLQEMGGDSVSIYKQGIC